MADHMFTKFKSFLELHSLGNLIDPDSGAEFRRNNTFFSSRKNIVTRDFIKKLGNLYDDDIFRMASLLVDVPQTKADSKCFSYPRLSMHKAKHYRRSQSSVGDWSMRTKSKRVAMEEFASIRPTLSFLKTNSTSIDKGKWQKWKQDKGFSTASWNMLFGHPPPKYYSVRLRNEARCKTAADLLRGFPDVLSFFTNFLTKKTGFKLTQACFSIRTIEMGSLILGDQWEGVVVGAPVTLGVMDIRDTPFVNCKTDESQRMMLNKIMNKVKILSDPSYTTPRVWVFIVHCKAKNLDRLKGHVHPHFSNYDVVASSYKTSKAEHLYNGYCSNLLANEVHLLFFFKKGDPKAVAFKDSVKPEYGHADVPYYADTGLYNEAKWMAKESELRMEFYIELIKAYCDKGDSTMGIFSGSKFMVASMVSSRQSQFLVPDYHRAGDSSLR